MMVMMSNNVYHNPVLLQACIDNLNIKPDGVYVDLTFAKNLCSSNFGVQDAMASFNSFVVAISFSSLAAQITNAKRLAL